MKNLNDNLNNIHGLNYIIVPNYESNTEIDNELKNNNKVSNIEQKEYMINISNFRTFIDPANEIFYTQNTFYNPMLKSNVHETNERRKRWGLFK